MTKTKRHLTSKYPGEVNVAPVSLRYLAVYLEEMGFSASNVFRSEGKDLRDLLRHDRTITFSQASAIIKRAIDLSGNEFIGLLVAARKSFTSGGIYALAMLSAPTCLDGLRCGIRYYNIAGTLIEPWLEQTEPDVCEMSVHSRFPDPRVLRFLIDEQLASTAAFIRFATRDIAAVKKAEFTYDQGKNKEVYERFYKCPVEFGCDRNRLILDRAMLNRPMRTADPYIFEEMEELLQKSAARQEGTGEFIRRVETAIKKNLARGASQSQIAAEIGTGERTLRRKLADNELNYRSLLDNIRYTRACELLSQTGKTIETIAIELGFADIRTFRQAFFRWSGHSPTNYRKRSQTAPYQPI